MSKKEDWVFSLQTIIEAEMSKKSDDEMEAMPLDRMAFILVALSLSRLALKFDKLMLDEGGRLVVNPED